MMKDFFSLDTEPAYAAAFSSLEAALENSSSEQAFLRTLLAKTAFPSASYTTEEAYVLRLFDPTASTFIERRDVVEELISKAMKTDPENYFPLSEQIERLYLRDPEIASADYSAHNVLTPLESDEGVVSSVLLLPKTTEGYAVSVTREKGQFLQFSHTSEPVDPNYSSDDVAGLSEILSYAFHSFNPNTSPKTTPLKDRDNPLYARACEAARAYRNSLEDLDRTISMELNLFDGRT